VIPSDFVTEWRSQAPWVESSQVEQDLVISRALVEIFGDDRLAEALASKVIHGRASVHATVAKSEMPGGRLAPASSCGALGSRSHCPTPFQGRSFRPTSIGSDPLAC
jgi:hypothetical protein